MKGMMSSWSPLGRTSWQFYIAFLWEKATCKFIMMFSHHERTSSCSLIMREVQLVSVYFRVWGLSQRWCKPNNSCSLIHLWKQHLNRNEVLSNTVGRLFGRLFKASSLATRFHMLVISQCDEKNAFHYPISTPQKYNIEMAGYSFLLPIPEKKKKKTFLPPFSHLLYALLTERE